LDGLLCCAGRLAALGLGLVHARARVAGRLPGLAHARGHFLRQLPVLRHLAEVLGDLVFLGAGLGRLALGTGRGLLLFCLDLDEVLTGRLQVADRLGRGCGHGGRALRRGRALRGLRRLVQAGQHPVLLRQGLVPLGLEELGGRLRGRVLGLVERLGGLGRGPRLVGQLGHVLLNLPLLLDKLLHVAVAQVGLAGGLAHLLLAVDELADVLLDRRPVVVHQPLDPLEDLQQLAQGLEHVFLMGGGVGKAGLLEGLGGAVHLHVHAGLLEHRHRLGRQRADFPAPGGHVLDRRLQAQVNGLHVALVLKGREHERLALRGGLLGQRLGDSEDLGLRVDEAADLGGQLGDAQAAQDPLPLDQKLHENLAALLAHGDKRLVAIARGGLDLREQLDDAGHLGLDQLVDVTAHGADVAVELGLGEAVLVELHQLDVEDGRDQVAGHGADLLLGLLFPDEAWGGLVLRDGPGRARHAQDCDDHPLACSVHFPAPTSIWLSIMVWSRRADSRSASAMAA